MSVRCWHNHFWLRGLTARPTNCSLQCLSRPKKAGLAVTWLAVQKSRKAPPFGQDNFKIETFYFSTGNYTHMYFKLSHEVFRGYCILFRLLQSCNFCVSTLNLLKYIFKENSVTLGMFKQVDWKIRDCDAEFNNTVLKVLLGCANRFACFQSVTASLLKATRMRKSSPKHIDKIFSRLNKYEHCGNFYIVFLVG